LVTVFQQPTAQNFTQITQPVTTEYLNFGEPSAAEAQIGIIADFSLEPLIYPAVYFILIVLFTFFYTGITFNAKEISENLQKQGGFLEGVRSGKSTEKYLRYVVNRLTLFGSIALGVVALGPILVQIFLQSDLAVGGTSVLILVAVALETMRQLESRALMVTYDDYSTPDFVYGPDENDTKNHKKKRFSLRRNSNKNKKVKKDDN
jgi:preprotein translocase subunit SecY